jgi:hypothetical protein
VTGARDRVDPQDFAHQTVISPGSGRTGGCPMP